MWLVATMLALKLKKTLSLCLLLAGRILNAFGDKRLVVLVIGVFIVGFGLEVCIFCYVWNLSC